MLIKRTKQVHFSTDCSTFKISIACGMLFIMPRHMVLLCLANSSNVSNIAPFKSGDIRNEVPFLWLLCGKQAIICPSTPAEQISVNDTHSHR